MLSPTHNNSSLKTPIVQCAFHQSSLITHFCNYHQCLLPVCKECIPIHRRQHNNLPQPMKLITAATASQQVMKSLKYQQFQVNDLFKSIIEKYELSNAALNNFKLSLVSERQKLIQLIVKSYQPYFRSIHQSYEKNKNWMLKIQDHMTLIKEQMQNIQISLLSQKYLRTIIMWHRCQPFNIFNDIKNKIVLKKDNYSIQSIDFGSFYQFINRNRNMQISQFQQYLDLQKIIRIFKKIKIGDQPNKNSRSYGIEVTDQKRKAKENRNIEIINHK